MTLATLLQEKGISSLSKRDVSMIGAKIAAKFRAKNGTPDKIEVIENGFTIKVIDYPDEWLRTSGARVVDNHMKLLFQAIANGQD